MAFEAKHLPHYGAKALLTLILVAGGSAMILASLGVIGLPEKMVWAKNADGVTDKFAWGAALFKLNKPLFMRILGTCDVCAVVCFWSPVLRDVGLETLATACVVVRYLVIFWAHLKVDNDFGVGAVMQTSNFRLS